MKASPLIPILLVVLLTYGCASVPVADEAITAEVLSSPEGLEMTFRGKVVGPAPLILQLDNLQQAIELSTTQDQPPIIERRIKVLADDRVQITIRLGENPSPVAKALGLARVVVFDYGDLTTFELESYELKSSLEPVLRRQADLLKTHFSELDIYLCGHTDSTGEDEFNQVLSLNRAQTVADFLIAQGIDQDRIQVQGFGAEYPIASNDTRDGRGLNRRTEILLPD